MAEARAVAVAVVVVEEEEEEEEARDSVSGKACLPRPRRELRGGAESPPQSAWQREPASGRPCPN